MILSSRCFTVAFQLFLFQEKGFTAEDDSFNVGTTLVIFLNSSHTYTIEVVVKSSNAIYGMQLELQCFVKSTKAIFRNIDVQNYI